MSDREPFDLTIHPPRSPRFELGGLFILARTIDKVRAKLAGSLGPYRITPGMSGALFEALGVSESDFTAAVRDSDSDDGVVSWVHARSDRATYSALNEQFASRGIRDEAHREQMLSAYPWLRERPELSNWFEILDLDDRETFERAKREGGMNARFVTFSHGSGAPRPGLLEADTVRPFARVASLRAYIALEAEERTAERAHLEAPLPLADVTLHAPLAPHKNVFCVGRNYVAHVAESAGARGLDVDLPKIPVFFTKAPTAIAGPGAVLQLPPVSEKFDWEAEVAVVIGRRCRDVAEVDALDVIFGYMCLNDITARDLQSAHVQWFKGKSLDDSCPIGPWIVPACAVGDPQALDVTLRVNGVVKQHASTSQMIFSIKRIIAELSRGLTLEPGDIVATGTPEGVGFARKPPEFLHDGDVVEVEIEKLGTLTNRIALAVPSPV